MILRPSFRRLAASTRCHLASCALSSSFSSISAAAVEDACSAPNRFGESEEEGPFRNWREERVGVGGLDRSDGEREGKTPGLVLRLEASHRLAQEGRLKEMRLVLNEMVEEEGMLYRLSLNVTLHLSLN
jgi:hypothetical protein